MIAVDGGATAESGDLRIRVEASGTALTATVDGVSGVVDALRRVRSMAPFVRSVVPFLVRTGLTVDVVVGGVSVARAGAGVKTSPIARVFRVSNLKIGR